MSKKPFIIALTIAMLAQACSSDADFAVSQQDCGGFSISSPDGAQVSLQLCDTAWWIMQSAGESAPKPIHIADSHKISAFFNVLRDIQVMGLSIKDAAKDRFDCRIELRGASGRAQKEIRLQGVPGSPQMVGSVNGGQCYIVGVPGLRQSPIEDFSPTVEYWKDRSLLTIAEAGISAIAVRNIQDPAQGFSIKAEEGKYSVYGADSQFIDIPQQNILQYLGAIAGSYRAAQYVDSSSAIVSDMIYSLKVRSIMGAEDSIYFYKKYLPDGQPDFNQMYFRKGADIGTAKYFDFDRLLVDLDKLRG